MSDVKHPGRRAVLRRLLVGASTAAGVFGLAHRAAAQGGTRPRNPNGGNGGQRPNGPPPGGTHPGGMGPHGGGGQRPSGPPPGGTPPSGGRPGGGRGPRG